MELRKFIVSLVSKFDARGFKDADKEGRKLEKTAGRVSKSFDKLAQSQLGAAKAAIVLAQSQAKAAEAAEKAGKEAAKAAKGAKSSSISFSDLKDQVGKLAPIAGGAITALTALGAAGAAVTFGVLKTGVGFESLRARLKTVEGSAEGAKAAFSQIQEFTKATPFQLEEVTTAFVRLKSLGLDASKESMTSFGNLAAAQGKSIVDFIEAVADASTGEFERLKEFGIKAKTEGDNVSFVFKGQTTTVKKESAAIQAYLKNLGETQFAGAMEDQMATTAGQLSNLQDSVSVFFDKVSQSGALDAFKGLLGDLAAKLQDSDGFAQTLSDGIVSAIERIREFIQGVTAEDIQQVLDELKGLAESVMDAIAGVVSAFQTLVEWSGSTGDALENLTLIIFAVIAAMTGPVGLVIAAGLVGAAIGRMAANAIADFTGLNDAIAQSDARIKELNSSIAATQARIKLLEDFKNRQKESEKQFEEDMTKIADDRLKAQVGGLGEGLVGDSSGLTRQEKSALATALEKGGTEGEAARKKLLSNEGRVILEAVDKAAEKRVAAAEKQARAEAKKRGEDETAAAKAAREAVVASNLSSRQKALEKATATFSQTGSAEAAAEAAAAEIGKVKGAAKQKKGKKGKKDDFFDFEKDAESAAKKQGEVFAQQELQRLRSEGVAAKEALAQAQAAGKKRADELKQRFLEAGRIFDASANNILDILGLRGPGSVLEGRPPPQSLIIAPHFEINFIRTFEQSIGQVTGAKSLEEITGQAGEAAIQQGLEPNKKLFEEMVMGVLSLQMERFLKLAGGGAQPQGPEQG